MKFRETKASNVNILVKAPEMLSKVLIVFIAVTACISFFSSVSTTIMIGGTWLYLYIGVLLIILPYITISLLRNKEKHHIKGGAIEKIGVVLFVLLGFSFLALFSIFSGVPSALHYLDSSHGEIKVTVSEKENRYYKRKCSPRLIIKEFSFFTSDYVCLNEEAFESISVGDKITIIGNISKYGVESKQIKSPIKPSK